MVYEYANRSDVISMIGSYCTPVYVVRRVDAGTNEVMLMCLWRELPLSERRRQMSGRIFSIPRNHWKWARMGRAPARVLGNHQVREPPVASCLRGIRMRNKNPCPFGAMINVIFNYLESLQQVLITETPLAVSTCHMVPLDMLTPCPLALLN